MNEIATRPQSPSALAVMASNLQVEPGKLYTTLKNTVFKGANDDELLALVVVANEYRLNPLLKELYAFPAKGGGIVPMVPIDGWTKIVNRQKSYNGCQFSYDYDDGKITACTCTMHVKDRAHPVVVTEFLAECSRNTEPWRQMPGRMLRHKAFMQAARLAFGLTGIHDQDEAEDIAERFESAKPVNVTVSAPTFLAPPPVIQAPFGEATQPEPVPIRRGPGRPRKVEPAPEPALLPAPKIQSKLEAAAVAIGLDYLKVQKSCNDAALDGLGVITAAGWSQLPDAQADWLLANLDEVAALVSFTA